MAADFEFDTKEFERAMDIVQQATGKSQAEILNRAALHTIIGGKGVSGAIQRTPKASRSSIMRLESRVLAGAVIARAKRKGDWPLTSAEVAARIKKERNRRLSSIAYTAGPGWHNASVAFGGKGVKRQRGFEKSKARLGYGKRAKIHSLVAEIANTAPAADKIGRQALQDALNDQARDMVQYGESKLQKDFDKVSAR